MPSEFRIESGGTFEGNRMLKGLSFKDNDIDNPLTDMKNTEDTRVSVVVFEADEIDNT